MHIIGTSNYISTTQAQTSSAILKSSTFTSELPTIIFRGKTCQLFLIFSHPFYKGSTTISTKTTSIIQTSEKIPTISEIPTLITRGRKLCNMQLDCRLLMYI